MGCIVTAADCDQYVSIPFGSYLLKILSSKSLEHSRWSEQKGIVLDQLIIARRFMSAVESLWHVPFR